MQHRVNPFYIISLTNRTVPANFKISNSFRCTMLWLLEAGSPA